jgi:hypothetical protein
MTSEPTKRSKTLPIEPGLGPWLPSNEAKTNGHSGFLLKGEELRPMVEVLLRKSFKGLGFLTANFIAVHVFAQHWGFRLFHINLVTIVDRGAGGS